jgi:hypothetical protein
MIILYGKKQRAKEKYSRESDNGERPTERHYHESLCPALTYSNLGLNSSMNNIQNIFNKLSKKSDGDLFGFNPAKYRHILKTVI